MGDSSKKGHTKIKSGDGFELGVYEAQPTGASKGAVVVIQEIFGVNKQLSRGSTQVV